MGLVSGLPIRSPMNTCPRRKSERIVVCNPGIVTKEGKYDLSPVFSEWENRLLTLLDQALAKKDHCRYMSCGILVHHPWTEGAYGDRGGILVGMVTPYNLKNNIKL